MGDIIRDGLAGDPFVIGMAAFIGALLLGVLFCIIRAFQSDPKLPMEQCGGCGHQVRPVTTTPGSGGVELLLLLFFVVPGVFYSMWRHANRRKVCSFCESCDLVPIDSPRGRELATRYSRAVA